MNTVYEALKRAFQESDQAIQLTQQLCPNLDKSEFGYYPENFTDNFEPNTLAHVKSLGVEKLQGCLVYPLKNQLGKVTGLYGFHLQSQMDVFVGEEDGLCFNLQPKCNSVVIVESPVEYLSLLNQNPEFSIISLNGANGYSHNHLQLLKEAGAKKVSICLRPESVENTYALAELLSAEGFQVDMVNLESSVAEYLKVNTLEKLLECQGMPKTEKLSLTLVKNQHDYTVTGKHLVYRFTGLTPYGFESLRLTLKVSPVNNPSQMWINHVDFYRQKSVDKAVDGFCNRLSCDVVQTEKEIQSIIPLLEQERLSLADSPQAPKDDTYQMSSKEEAEALDYLKSKKLTERITGDIRRFMAPNGDAPLMTYLASISRFAKKPLGIFSVAQSGAGKSKGLDVITSFVPPEDLIKVTRLSRQSLFYQKDLKHKVLAVEEVDGAKDSEYAIRTLMSSQSLSNSVVSADEGAMESKLQTVDASVAVLVASTSMETLNHETRSRFIMTSVSDGEVMTGYIQKTMEKQLSLESHFMEESKNALQLLHQNIQRMIKPLKVVCPFSLEFEPKSLNARRDFAKYLSLVETIALLHQYQRPLKKATREGKTVEYIEVKKKDVELADKLAKQFILSKDELDPTSARLLSHIKNSVKDDSSDSFTVRSLREEMGWTDYSTRKALATLTRLEYISREGANSVKNKYTLL